MAHEIDDFDFSEPLYFALSQLNYPQEPDPFVHFPKPSTLSADVEDDPQTSSTSSIIDEIVESLDDYPRLIRILMQRGFLRRRQQCRKCDRPMHLRRRKNFYEWRCRSKDKRSDCSSCSIKYGSWFEYTKLPFKSICNLLILHCKNVPTSVLAHELKLTTHTVGEAKKTIYELTERICRKYSKLGEDDNQVYIEVISIGELKVLAGQEPCTRNCFATVLPDEHPITLERIRKEHVKPTAKITLVVTVNDNSIGCAGNNAQFLDESTLGDKFFTSLRSSEVCRQNSDGLQMYLNEMVVRRVEGDRYLERCVEELTSFL